MTEAEDGVFGVSSDAGGEEGSHAAPSAAPSPSEQAATDRDEEPATLQAPAIAIELQQEQEPLALPEEEQQQQQQQQEQPQEQQPVEAQEGDGGDSRPKKKKKRRWGPETEEGVKVLTGQADDVAAAAPEPQAPKRRKSRWEPEESKSVPGLSAISLPAHLAALVDVNPESLELQRRLTVINQQLQLIQAGKLVDDDTPPEQRSPSPEPVYNDNGVRTNTREQRLKEKLLRERQSIITDLIRLNPSYKPPADYRPEKKYKKLYIPQKDYPGYNFIGLIIGPRGNTQKRMERETGAKIAIRGKGSIKEGRAKKETKPDPSENDELHVLITGETEEQVEAAARLIAPLLEPMDEDVNEHKKNQLFELAKINGTLRDSEFWEAQKAEQEMGDVYKLPDNIKEQVEKQYAKDVVARNPEEAGKMEDAYKNFLQELGGDPAAVERTAIAEAEAAAKPVLDYDPCNLYVGYIPQHVEEAVLAKLFATCGEVIECKIIFDRHTGQSKGFGFVRMATEHGAGLALDRLNNHPIGNKRLVVRIKGKNNLVRPNSETLQSQPSSGLPPPPADGVPPLPPLGHAPAGFDPYFGYLPPPPGFEPTAAAPSNPRPMYRESARSQPVEEEVPPPGVEPTTPRRHSTTYASTVPASTYVHNPAPEAPVEEEPEDPYVQLYYDLTPGEEPPPPGEEHILAAGMDPSQYGYYGYGYGYADPVYPTDPANMTAAEHEAYMKEYEAFMSESAYAYPVPPDAGAAIPGPPAAPAPSSVPGPPAERPPSPVSKTRRGNRKAKAPVVQVMALDQAELDRAKKVQEQEEKARRAREEDERKKQQQLNKPPAPPTESRLPETSKFPSRRPPSPPQRAGPQYSRPSPGRSLSPAPRSPPQKGRLGRNARDSPPHRMRPRDSPPLRHRPPIDHHLRGGPRHYPPSPPSNRYAPSPPSRYPPSPPSRYAPSPPSRYQHSPPSRYDHSPPHSRYPPSSPGGRYPPSPPGGRYMSRSPSPQRWRSPPSPAGPAADRRAATHKEPPQDAPGTAPNQQMTAAERAEQRAKRRAARKQALASGLAPSSPTPAAPASPKPAPKPHSPPKTKAPAEPPASPEVSEEGEIPMSPGEVADSPPPQKPASPTKGDSSPASPMSASPSPRREPPDHGMHASSRGRLERRGMDEYERPYSRGEYYDEPDRGAGYDRGYGRPRGRYDSPEEREEIGPPFRRGHGYMDDGYDYRREEDEYGYREVYERPPPPAGRGRGRGRGGFGGRGKPAFERDYAGDWDYFSGKSLY